MPKKLECPPPTWTAAPAPGWLPVVDIGSWLGQGDLDTHTVQELERALTTLGFAYVTNHGIAPDTFHALERGAREFFALPSAAKLAYHIQNSPNHRGYVPPGEEVFYGTSGDTKEAFDTGRELALAPLGPLCKLLGPNVWPREVPGLRAAACRYYEQVFGLGRQLLRALACALGEAPSSFDACLNCPPSQLRLLHYPETTGQAGQAGIGAHTDYECLTLLHTTAPGLEVLSPSGHWVSAPPVAGALLVSIGDLLEVWSNGRLRATPHRVVGVDRERYSFPFFFSVDYETRIVPLSGSERRYQPLVAGEHLLAQTLQTFNYLKARLARGELAPHFARGQTPCPPVTRADH